jgi:hypothetical protein
VNRLRNSLWLKFPFGYICCSTIGMDVRWWGKNDMSLYCVFVFGRGILLLTSLSRIFRCSLAAVDGVSSPPFTPLTYLTSQVPSKPILWYPPPLELLHLDHALSTVPAQCVPGILFLLRGSVLGVPAWLEEMSILLSATRWEVYGSK